MPIDTSSSERQQSNAGSNIINLLSLAMRSSENKAEAPQRDAQLRVTKAHAESLEQQNTLEANLSKQFPDLVQEYAGVKDSADMFRFNSKYSNLVATPKGRQIMEFLNESAWKTFEFESKTMEGQMKQAVIKDNFDLVTNWGARPDDEGSFPVARQQRNWSSVKKELASQGRDPNSIQFDQGLFNESGDFLNPGVRDRLMQMADPSLALQQREDESLLRLQMAQQRGERQSPGMVAAQEIIEAQAAVDAARRTGNPQAIQQTEQLLQSLKDAFPTRGTEEIEMRQDDQGRPIFRMIKGGKAGGLGPTVATESEAQKRIMAASRTFQDIQGLEQSLRPEDLGIQGVIGEKVFDRLLGQFAPEIANDKRTDNRTKLKLAIEGMVRQVTNDPRFSNADRAEAKDALPSAGAMDSYPRVVRSLRTIKTIFSKRAIVDAKAAGAPVQDWMIGDLSDEDIVRLNLDGILTKEDALNIYNRLHGTPQP